MINYRVTPDMLQLRGPDVRQAFEVEDIGTRENYTLVYEPISKRVEFYNTSRGIGRRLDLVYQEQDGCLVPKTEDKGYLINLNPLGCREAYEYFRKLYSHSAGLTATYSDICFLGWVDPDTIEPLADYVDPL